MLYICFFGLEVQFQSSSRVVGVVVDWRPQTSEEIGYGRCSSCKTRGASNQLRLRFIFAELLFVLVVVAFQLSPSSCIQSLTLSKRLDRVVREQLLLDLVDLPRNLLYETNIFAVNMWDIIFAGTGMVALVFLFGSTHVIALVSLLCYRIHGTHLWFW